MSIALIPDRLGTKKAVEEAALSIVEGSKGCANRLGQSVFVFRVRVCSKFSITFSWTRARYAPSFEAFRAACNKSLSAMS
jgi:hypothetical protein